MHASIKIIQKTETNTLEGQESPGTNSHLQTVWDQTASYFADAQRTSFIV